jgi:V8-like Glu-specific endopeptidase
MVFIEAQTQSGKIHGTGTLISPNLVITAANCLYSRSAFSKDAKSIHIFPQH